MKNKPSKADEAAGFGHNIAGWWCIRNVHTGCLKGNKTGVCCFKRMDDAIIGIASLIMNLGGSPEDYIIEEFKGQTVAFDTSPIPHGRVVAGGELERN